jgi:hypothetical protein
MLALRALTRLVGVVLMVVIALAGLAVALYCLSRLVSLGAANPPRLLHLPTVRDRVGGFLADLAAPGPTAGIALGCGGGAIALGLLILVGMLAPRRSHVALVDRSASHGIMGARRRALRDLARALAAQADGLTSVKRARVALSRRGTRGRVTVIAAHTPATDPDQVQRAVRETLVPITDTFHLRPRVRVRVPNPAERVQ